MVTLRRIGIFSAGRVGFFFGLATTIINLAYFMFDLFVIQGLPTSILTPEVWALIARQLLISSLLVGVGVGFFAVLYNMGLGGLKLEFEMSDGLTPKRKNDDLVQDVDDIEEID